MNCHADKETNHVAVEEGYFWFLVREERSASFSMKTFDKGNGK
jgi:hypothetical protein